MTSPDIMPPEITQAETPLETPAETRPRVVRPPAAQPGWMSRLLWEAHDTLDDHSRLYRLIWTSIGCLAFGFLAICGWLYGEHNRGRVAAVFAGLSLVFLGMAIYQCRRIRWRRIW
jgi:hypothetical protein